MPHATANGIQIEYDTFGDRSAPALLLIAGNGAQMIVWDSAFCELLAKRGLHVIRFDNRDVGLSTKFDEAGMPDLMAAFQAAMLGRKVESAYTLDDMADDAVGLLDALGISKAHICGASMGGMIAQIVAFRHPEHVLSLTSMMSTTGNPALPFGRQDAIAALLAPAPEERGAYVEHYVNVWRRIWSPGFPFEEENVRRFMEKSYDRSYCPQGMARQNAAIIAGGDRRPKLASVKAPALVIHGADDPLIPVAGGKDTAMSIPGAKLIIVDGMGHDMPQGVWAQILDAIAEHAAQAKG
jgi:pimeloyl-ACP methyl ester carboxylesterase